MNANPEPEVGARLRSLRRKRQLTLARLAELTGIAESTLSRLENGRLQPTLAQLLPLARVHGLGLDELIGLHRPRVEGVIHRHGATFVPLSHQRGGIRAYKMFSPARETLVEPDPRTHDGFAWVHVLTGRLRFVLGNRDLVLTAGESAEYDTSLPHWMGHADHDPVEALLLFGPQGERTRLRARTRDLTPPPP
ncbi:helix-turn-helix domain-containing protein [Cryptosporangium arvum]|uniref:helix-turn-helix domain-containing protein n=1 Tax=Cryptosporangium arvum TaxID=80871 RepID=UPI0004B83F34|nr:XRE family transcriptional regulator [Cryptosporangium arvum]